VDRGSGGGVVGEHIRHIDGVHVLGSVGAVGELAQLVASLHRPGDDLLEQLDELVDALAVHLPVFFLGESGDTTDVALVLASTFPREIARSHEVLPSLGHHRVHAGAEHEAQLALHVLVGAVRGDGDRLIADVGDDHLEALWVAPVLLEIDEVVRVEYDERHPLVGEALVELFVKLIFEPVHEHPEDVHAVDFLEVHDCSFYSGTRSRLRPRAI